MNDEITGADLAALTAPSSAGGSLSAQVGRLTDELRRAQTLHFNYVYEVSRIANHEDSICNFPETDKVREWIANLTEQVLATHRQPEDGAALRDALTAVDDQLVAILNKADGYWYNKLKAARDDLVRIWLPLAQTTATKEASVQGVPELPKPDTHCYDEDLRTDVWSHSAEQMHTYAKQYAAAIRAQMYSDSE